MLKTYQGIAPMALLLLLLLSPCLAAFAADVPTQVLDSRGGVVRVISIYGAEDVIGGSGFAVGTDDEVRYIVTNHHVIEGDPLSIQVMTDEEIPYRTSQESGRFVWVWILVAVAVVGIIVWILF